MAKKETINKASDDAKAKRKGRKRDEQGKSVAFQNHKTVLAEAIAALRTCRAKYKQKGELAEI
jgi:hypothetical protein